MDEIQILEANLARAQHQLKHRKHDVDWETVYETLFKAERELAAAKGEPYAITLDFPVRWDIGAPLAHVLTDGRLLHVIFLDSRSGLTDYSFGVVTFRGFESMKFGTPNDEVFEGHYLYGKGQDPYRAQQVINSPWIAEAQEINSIHHGYSPRRWKELNHYIFWFHDNTFECISEGYAVEVINRPLSEVIQKVSATFLE